LERDTILSLVAEGDTAEDGADVSLEMLLDEVVACIDEKDLFHTALEDWLSQLLQENIRFSDFWEVILGIPVESMIHLLSAEIMLLYPDEKEIRPAMLYCKSTISELNNDLEQRIREDDLYPQKMVLMGMAAVSTPKPKNIKDAIGYARELLPAA